MRKTTQRLLSGDLCWSIWLFVGLIRERGGEWGAGMNGSYELREPTAAYEAVFDAENGDLRQKMPSIGTYIGEYQIVERVREKERRGK
jgi:hypothetical protein